MGVVLNQEEENNKVVGLKRVCMMRKNLILKMMNIILIIQIMLFLKRIFLSQVNKKQLYLLVNNINFKKKLLKMKN
jgi:hypothetical protein